MATDDSCAKDVIYSGFARAVCFRCRVDIPCRQDLHLAWTKSRRMGARPSSICGNMVLDNGSLVPSLDRLDHAGDYIRFFIWILERVRSVQFLTGHGPSEIFILTLHRWFLYASATIVGSTLSFIVSRTVLSGLVKRMMENDKRFAALALTLKYDGLKLLCMIRLCPLPYSICNGAVSTFPTVKPLNYGLATAIIAPKLMVHAFIGSRIRILSENNEEMSAGAKAVNIISIIVSVSIGIATGFYIYKRYALKRSRRCITADRISD